MVTYHIQLLNSEVSLTVAEFAKTVRTKFLPVVIAVYTQKAKKRIFFRGNVNYVGCVKLVEIMKRILN